MPKEILIRVTNTGFFLLTMDGQDIGVYGNPAKAMNECMRLIGYKEEVEEARLMEELAAKCAARDIEIRVCDCRQHTNLGRCDHE